MDVVPESVKELVLFGIKPLFTFKPLLGRVAMHIIRWPPVFSISDQAFADLVDLLASTSELDIIMYFKAIMQVGIENKDCANSCVELLGSILTCQKLYAKLEEQFSDPDEKRIALGMAAKETLLSFRNKVFGLWGDGNNKEDFFNMGLTEWLDGMWDLKNIYRSREVVEGCIKTHFYESIKTWAAPDEEKTACWKKIEKRMDVQEDHQVFVDEILDIIKPDVLHLTAYREIMTRDEIFYSDFRRAQQLDCYYSGLVKGAGVRIGTDRVWAAPDVPAPDVLVNLLSFSLFLYFSFFLYSSDESSLDFSGREEFRGCGLEGDQGDASRVVHPQQAADCRGESGLVRVCTDPSICDVLNPFFPLRAGQVEQDQLPARSGDCPQDEGPQGLHDQHLEREQDVQDHRCCPYD